MDPGTTTTVWVKFTPDKHARFVPFPSHQEPEDGWKRRWTPRSGELARDIAVDAEISIIGWKLAEPFASATIFQYRVAADA